MTRPLIGITTHPRAAGAGADDQLPAQAAYVRAVESAGGTPVFIPLDLGAQALRDLFDHLDGLLLSGGGDLDPRRYGAAPSGPLREVDERRDEIEINLARWASQAGKPLLGICRGLQAANVAHGGDLIQDIALEQPQALDHEGHDRPPGALAHPVELEVASRLRDLVGLSELQANSSHHQAVKTPAPGWRVAGRAPDGIVEALELPGHPFALAVQWHPERLPQRPESQALFVALTRAAAQG